MAKEGDVAMSQLPPDRVPGKGGLALLHGFFEPCVLLLLSESRVPTHGYRLLERLTAWDVGTSADRGNLYRLLRRLEREGLVHSAWQPGQSGPGRRAYALTALGLERLHQWQAALERDQRAIEDFLHRARRQPRYRGEGRIKVTYVITEPCIGVKDASCVAVCPVDCIYSTDDDEQYYIHPDECIDCGACEPECPVNAIFAEDEVPVQWQHFIQINADYFKDK
jgi:DNA-binding PadR family transcriptional regulator